MQKVTDFATVIPAMYGGNLENNLIVTMTKLFVTTLSEWSVEGLCLPRA